MLLVFFVLTIAACDMNGVVETEPTYYDLTIVVEGEGTTEPEPGTHEYAENTVAHIVLYPEENWKYDRFEGPDSENIYRQSIKKNLLPMDDNKSIIVVFVPEVEIAIISQKIVNGIREIEIEYNITAGIDGYIKFIDEEMFTPNLIEIKDGYAKEIHEVYSLDEIILHYELLDEEGNFIKEDDSIMLFGIIDGDPIDE